MRLSGSAFLAENSSSVSTPFWRRLASCSLRLKMSSDPAGCPAILPHQRGVGEIRVGAFGEAGSAVRTHDRQFRDPGQTILAGEGERLVAALLLGEAADILVTDVYTVIWPLFWIASRRVAGNTA